MKNTILLIFVTFALTAPARAQNLEMTLPEARKLADGLKYQHGEVTLKGGLAKFNLTPEFKFLGHEDAETILVKLWHNPPSPSNLGLLVPADFDPLMPSGWAVTVSYDEEGYVKDTDAAKINYDDLLKQMKQGTAEASKKRVQQGYPSIELIGWATPPRYDAQAHKLYWARELKFGNSSENTLNYNIRILGRRGVLVLNAIGGMDQLGEIEKNSPQILGMVNFNEGNRYADFDPKIDKVATYGIAALIAGGVAAKLGLFKLLIPVLLAAKKFIIIAFVAAAAWFKRVFRRKNATAATATPTPPPPPPGPGSTA